MSTLWLPPSEGQRHADARAQANAELERQVEQISFLETWDRELKLIDHRLTMVRAKENSHQLVPGRYYVLMVEAGIPTAIFPPDGSGYEEPTSQVYEDIRRWDGWSSRSQAQREKRMKELERAQESRRRREHEDRFEHAKDVLHQMERPWVSFSRDHKWTNTTRGRRGRAS